MIAGRPVVPLVHGLRSWSWSFGRTFSVTAGVEKKTARIRDVRVVRDDDGYELSLDGRKLRTPMSSVFRVQNQLLALAIANEWRSDTQMKHKHLTSLSCTVIDNPMRLTMQSLADSISDFLTTDSLCFRSREPAELVHMEQQLWDPHVHWFSDHIGEEISVTADMSGSGPVPEATCQAFRSRLLEQPFAVLVGLLFAAENLKSAILCTALTQSKLSVADAVRLSRLETEFQVSQWGKFATHDADEVQVRSRVAAAVLFVLCHRNHQ